MSKLKLTCPECCYVALRRVGRHKWECEECGTSFNLAKMRNSLDALAGRLLPGEFISKLLGDANIQGADEFGERDYKWVGRYGFLYATDCGNDWFAVLKGKKRLKISNPGGDNGQARQKD